MAATADKARYFLEQSVPELKEYERKKIFTADEITSIAKRRSDFEHKINARGSTPSDYMQYAEFETAVEALRRKRVKRYGIKSTTHNGQRRIFFVFDRGTRKFPGDLELWMQNVQHCRRQEAYKKFTETMTNALRLHPTKPELWIFAAACAMEDKGDINEARSYMQRALRFVKRSQSLWIEYARLELAYMAKIHLRRQVLGIGNPDARDPMDPPSEDDNMIPLPRLTAEDIDPASGGNHDVDESVLRKLDSTPVMSGAIPKAIFETAMNQFPASAIFAHRFFDMTSEFCEIPAAMEVLQLVLEKMKHTCPRSWQYYACDAENSLLQVSSTSLEFPEALRMLFRKISEGISGCSDKAPLVGWYQGRLQKLLQQDLDSALRAAIVAKLASLK